MSNVIHIGMKMYGHDSAIFAIMPKQQKVFAISSERLSRYKHDYILPFEPLIKFIEYNKIDPKSIEKIYLASSFTCQEVEKISNNFYDREFHQRKFLGAEYLGDYIKAKNKFKRIGWLKKVRSTLSSPHGRKLLILRSLSLLGFERKSTLPSVITSHISKLFPNSSVEFRAFDHEFCHAVSSYVSSGFSSALLVTMDGYGDENCFSRAYTAIDGRITKVAESIAPKRKLLLPIFDSEDVEVECSIGGLYSYFTELLGYVPNADEGKVEALAALGIPVTNLVSVMKQATQYDSVKMSIVMDHQMLSEFFISTKWRGMYKENKREDIAATIQKYAEDTILDYVRNLIDRTGMKNLCLSGGVFANVIINLKIFETIVKNIHIVPAVADDGSAQGAALNSLLNEEDNCDLAWLERMEMPYFGTSYSNEDIYNRLQVFSEYIQIEDMGDTWPEATAEKIASGQIGAIFHGRMEWGPRALGNRSIIADARNEDSKRLINNTIKKREYFQPFCPSILIEEKERLFEAAYYNKHMTCAFRMKREYWESLPGAIHVDGTARVQFVGPEDNPNYYRLIKHVKKLTGFGVILNTSFNKHGRTIVEKPEDAIRDFLDTNLDFLVIEGLLVLRK